MDASQLIREELRSKHHIIWDWNGTLLADLEHNVRTMNELLHRRNLPPITTDHHRDHFGFPVIGYYEKLGFDTSPEVFQDLCDEFNALYEVGVKECSLEPGMYELLRWAHAQGKIQSVLSATRQDTLEMVLAHFGVREFFEHIYGIADNRAGSKVERGQALMVAATTEASHTVLIGDTDHDLEVGKALGVDVILVDHGHQSYERLSAIHHSVFRTDNGASSSR